MSLVSVAEASRLTGKSRNTIKNHLRTGDLSGTKNLENGIWEIDTSELIRKYGELKIRGADDTVNGDQAGHSGPSSIPDDLISEVATLRERLRQEAERRNELEDRYNEQVDFFKEQIAVKDKQLSASMTQIEDHRDRRAKTEDRAVTEKNEIAAERDRLKNIAASQHRKLKEQTRTHRNELDNATTIRALFAKWFSSDVSNVSRASASEKSQSKTA